MDARVRAHFWVPEHIAGVDDWDPDASPDRFPTGLGHNLLELYVRLRARGAPVALGPVPRPGDVVVAFAKSLRSPAAQRSLFRSLTSNPLIVIRSDINPSWRLRFAPDLEVMPYESAVSGPSQVWLPALPQRGMVRRSPARFGTIATVAFKGQPDNLPDFMRDDRWARTLVGLGLRWLLDLPRQWDGSEQRWHDFSEVDVAVCLRSTAEAHRTPWKPATKLINAWCAGAIPLVGAEPAYEDLVTPNRDAVAVHSERDVVETLAELATNRELVRTVEGHIAARAEEFAPDAVLARWEELIVRAAELSPASSDARERRRARVRLSLFAERQRVRERVSPLVALARKRP